MAYGRPETMKHLSDTAFALFDTVAKVDRAGNILPVKDTLPLSGQTVSIQVEEGLRKTNGVDQYIAQWRIRISDGSGDQNTILTNPVLQQIGNIPLRVTGRDGTSLVLNRGMGVRIEPAPDRTELH